MEIKPEARRAEVVELRERLFDGLVSLDTAAEAIGKTPRTLMDWGRQGFPVMKLGRSRYVHVERARAWLARHTAHISPPDAAA